MKDKTKKSYEVMKVKPDRAYDGIKTNGFMPWGAKVRMRIDAGKIVERLQRVALGEEEATQSEIMAARLLLDRTLPVIKPMEVEADVGQSAKTITNDNLFRIIEGNAKRIDSK